MQTREQRDAYLRNLHNHIHAKFEGDRETAGTAGEADAMSGGAPEGASAGLSDAEHHELDEKLGDPDPAPVPPIEPDDETAAEVEVEHPEEEH